MSVRGGGEGDSVSVRGGGEGDSVSMFACSPHGGGAGLIDAPQKGTTLGSAPGCSASIRPNVRALSPPTAPSSSAAGLARKSRAKRYDNGKKVFFFPGG